jgi:hypothetical protein
MQITKNIIRGSLIEDLNELVQLAKYKESVVAYMGGSYFVRPAAFMLNWPLSTILRTKIYHALKNETEDPQ